MKRHAGLIKAHAQAQILPRTLEELEEIVGRAIRDGAYDVAMVLVEKAMGHWANHPPYTEMAEEIVNDPYVGVELALEELRTPKKVHCKRCQELLELNMGVIKEHDLPECLENLTKQRNEARQDARTAEDRAQEAFAAMAEIVKKMERKPRGPV